MVSRSALVGVPAYNTRLLGDLSVPDAPAGAVVVAHLSTTNPRPVHERRFGEAMRSHGLVVLRLDLLTREESVNHAPERRATFDVPVLAHRLADATTWLAAQAQFANLPHGCVAMGQGAAAALTAIAESPESFRAFVSFDGHVDQAFGAADRVRTPTLFIAASENQELVALNQHVYTRLRSIKRLALVENTAALFDDQRSADEATSLAWSWLARFLGLTTPETSRAD
jgi:putative phosphoribosyl transferase